MSNLCFDDLQLTTEMTECLPSLALQTEPVPLAASGIVEMLLRLVACSPQRPDHSQRATGQSKAGVEQSNIKRFFL